MAQRRLLFIQGATPVPPVGVLLQSSVVLSESVNTITENTFITNGIPGAIVTLKCTDISGSHYPGDQYLYVFPANSNMTLNYTFPITLDASGNATFKTVCFAGNRPPQGGFRATLTIISMVGGVVGPYASKVYSHTN